MAIKKRGELGVKNKLGTRGDRWEFESSANTCGSREPDHENIFGKNMLYKWYKLLSEAIWSILNTHL